jgi:serine/threonine protein kinase
MDKYRISKTLGEGAFGCVWQGEVKSSGATVAIKHIKRKFVSWDECMQLKELKALQKLKHVNIVRLLELIRENQQLYFVFEFVTCDLCKFIQRQRGASGVPLGDSRRIMAELLAGLQHMHKHGFYHRDIKPENLLCSEDGTRVRIADLGLAREIRARPPFTEYVSTRW